VLIDEPEIVAEVRAAFDAYERALMANDLEALDRLFWDDSRTARYSPDGAHYGHAAISHFRRARDVGDIARVLERVQITAHGRDHAVALCEYRRLGTGRRGMQSQTWVRTGQGWRIVAAHVSLAPA